MGYVDNSPKGFWQHLVGLARDVTVISAVIFAIFMGIYNFTRPYWEPFSTLPERISDLAEEVSTNGDNIESLSIRLSDSLDPRIINFETRAEVLEDQVRPGDTISVLYFMRRNASCQTILEPVFYNINTNTPYPGTLRYTQRAPVTSTYILFPVAVSIPDNLPDGEYVYSPYIEPEDCGIYRRLRVPPTESFMVVSDE